MKILDNDFSIVNYYDLLDVKPTASLTEITKQYRKKSLINHPDKNQNIDSTCKMQELNAAKRVLTDEEERKKHDWEIFIYSLKNGDMKKVNFFLKNKCVNFDLSRFDINEKDNVGNTPLHCACFFNFVHSAELLLANGARVNAKGKDDNTPLHYAIMGNANIKLIKLLIKSNAKVNQKNNVGNTPLHYACFFNFFHIVELLLANGARVNAKGKDDNTPLHYAIMGNAEGKLIELLISKGCTIKQKNKNGFNSLQLAKDVFANQEIYNLLLKINHEQKRKENEQILLNINKRISDLEKDINNFKKDIADFEQQKINSFLNFMIKIISFGCINKNKNLNDEILIKNEQLQALLLKKENINKTRELFQAKITTLTNNKTKKINAMALKSKSAVNVCQVKLL